MWNDTDTPLAFLITFRSHGTWLHGDERGSVSRFRNRYKSSRLPAERKWLQINRERLHDEPVILDATQRRCVEGAARETCSFRKWYLHAINARTNHVHLVVSIGTKKPELALNAFKANATRMMKSVGDEHQVLGRTKVARDISGTKRAWRERLITFCTGKVMSCPILMNER